MPHIGAPVGDFNPGGDDSGDESEPRRPADRELSDEDVDEILKRISEPEVPE